MSAKENYFTRRHHDDSSGIFSLQLSRLDKSGQACLACRLIPAIVLCQGCEPEGEDSEKPRVPDKKPDEVVHSRGDRESDSRRILTVTNLTSVTSPLRRSTLCSWFRQEKRIFPNPREAWHNPWRRRDPLCGDEGTFSGTPQCGNKLFLSTYAELKQSHHRRTLFACLAACFPPS